MINREMDKFYTVKQLAEMFSVTQYTIRKMLEHGKLPYYQIGRQKRIAKEDVEKYLKHQEHEV